MDVKEISTLLTSVSAIAGSAISTIKYLKQGREQLSYKTSYAYDNIKKIAVIVLITASALAGIAGIYMVATKKQEYTRNYSKTETVFVDAYAEGKWYAKNDVPEEKTPEKYRITTTPEQGLFIEVEKESVEMLEHALRKAEINDAEKDRLNNHRVHHTPREIEHMLYGIANKNDDNDSGIRITKEDCKKALQTVNRGGGLGELTTY